MKIAVTKVFVKELNKYLKMNNIPYKAFYSTCNIDEYAWKISPFITDNMVLDYLSNIGVMRYITIVYPSEYYAMDKYITSLELNNLYTVGDNISEYMRKVIDYISIWKGGLIWLH